MCCLTLGKRWRHFDGKWRHLVATGQHGGGMIAELWVTRRVMRGGMVRWWYASWALSNTGWWYGMVWYGVDMRGACSSWSRSTRIIIHPVKNPYTLTCTVHFVYFDCIYTVINHQMNILSPLNGTKLKTVREGWREKIRKKLGRLPNFIKIQNTKALSLKILFCNFSKKYKIHLFTKNTAVYIKCSCVHKIRLK